MKESVPFWLVCLLIVTLPLTGQARPAVPGPTVEPPAPLPPPQKNAEGQHRIGPGQSIGEALSRVQPGETLYLSPGVYNEPVYVTSSGRPGAWITIQGEEATIRPGQAGWNGIQVTANYIRIVGVAVEGAQGDGISVENAHHVEVLDSRFADCGESGIQADYSDVLRFENNQCTGNAASGWFSGISLYQCRELTDDAPEGFRNIVRGNVCDRNFTYAGQHTDGNGIIIDDFRQTQTENQPVYPYSTLVENNTCRENGGKGIQVVWSDHVTVLNNWCEGNGQDPLDEGTWRGELSNANSSDNTFIGNVAIADLSASPYNRAILNTSHGGYVNRNVVWKGNTTWNGTPGDPSVFVEGGGVAPDPAENALGVKPNREADPCYSSACSAGAISFCDASFTPVSNAAYPDQSTDPVVEVAGCEIRLGGNTWRKIPLNYPLTARSVLTLEFRSDDEPEFAGIGLDDDDAYEDAKLFKLYGTQGFGIRTFDTYQGSGWQTYTIPIGEFYTGDMQYLLLINDNDRGRGEARFRNVRLSEQNVPAAASDPALSVVEPALSSSGANRERIRVFPNPFTNEVKYEYEVKNAERITVALYTLEGQRISTMTSTKEQPAGRYSDQLDTSHLKPGTYILRINSPNRSISVKLIKGNHEE